MSTADIRQNYVETGNTSAVSWPAIIGGAFAAAAISLTLLALGTGIGLGSVSAFGRHHNSAVSFTIKTAIWLIVIQWVASGLGGYLAGRLRTKWIGLHTDEVFFRDTAHGLLTWAVSTVVTAAFLASAASSVVSGGMQAASTVATGAAVAGASKTADSMNDNDPNGYFVDSLFRTNSVAPGGTPVNNKAESARIIANGIKNGDISPDDKTYLAQLVSNQTGLSQADATKRVDDTIAQIKDAELKAKQAAEAARKSGEELSFFTFFSLLIGAFIACVAAALGGKRRDEY